MHGQLHEQLVATRKHFCREISRTIVYLDGCLSAVVVLTDEIFVVFLETFETLNGDFFHARTFYKFLSLKPGSLQEVLAGLTYLFDFSKRYGANAFRLFYIARCLRKRKHNRNWLPACASKRVLET